MGTGGKMKGNRRKVVRENKWEQKEGERAEGKYRNKREDNME